MALMSTSLLCLGKHHGYHKNRSIYNTARCSRGKPLSSPHPPDDPENSPVLLAIHCLRRESGFAMELSLGDKDTV